MNTNTVAQPLEILVIADKPDEIRVLEDELAEVAPRQFILENTAGPVEALDLMTRKKFDMIMLDISLPDGTGLALFSTVRDKAGDIPIVVLTTIDDEQQGITAVHDGAQDYIVKGHVNTKHIAQSLHYAIERHRLRDKLVNMSLIDELTGLYNRRGFTNLAQQQLRMADRTRRGMFLFFLDLDDLKKINDSFGHHAGDMALNDAAAVLRDSFRQSDIIARIGGDEFAVLAIETQLKNKDVVLIRLQKNIAAHGVRGERPFALNLSVGVATYHPETPSSIETLLAQADAFMYEQKRMKKRLGNGGGRG